MNIGIDKIGFYTPNQYVDMEKLAEARGVEPAKYTIGIGQERMAVAPLHEDSVSMAANAALSILNEDDRAKIDFVLFGSESGVDHSKSGAVWVHQFDRHPGKCTIDRAETGLLRCHSGTENGYGVMSL
ncbi:MAG: hypothetical protein U5K84_13815 [Alkalibacterium sp.]|nr:hypothetical protein [Alkalibacterium sp.]